MPLPALIIPISITAASAIAQLGGKLQARRKIQEAQRRLESRRQQHDAAIADLRRRQDAAKSRAISGNVGIPSALLRAEPHTYEPPAAAPRRWHWRRLLPFGQPVLGGKVHSRKRIIAPKALTTTASVIYKANPAIVARITQPVVSALPELSAVAGRASALGGEAAALGGKAALFGGRTAAVAATGPGAIVGRVALIGFTVVGYIISPLLAGLSIYLDVRRVRKARRELAAADAAMTDLETQATAQTLELERITAQGLLSLSASAAASNPSATAVAPSKPANRKEPYLMRENKVKTALRENRLALGTYVSFADPQIVEIIGLAGYDAAFIDMEHTTFDLGLITQMIAAADLVGITSMIRIPGNDENLILRLLDAGAQGIIIPHIDGLDGAKRAVDAVRYAPLGHRGGAGGTRAARFGTVSWEEHTRTSNEQIVLSVMTEDEKGISEIADIAALPGIDIVAIGPTDFSEYMGIRDPQSPVIRARLEELAGQVKAAGGAKLSIPMNHPAYPLSARELQTLGVGYTHVAPPPPALLLRSLQERLGSIRAELA